LILVAYMALSISSFWKPMLIASTFPSASTCLSCSAAGVDVLPASNAPSLVTSAFNLTISASLAVMVLLAVSRSVVRVATAVSSSVTLACAVDRSGRAASICCNSSCSVQLTLVLASTFFLRKLKIFLKVAGIFMLLSIESFCCSLPSFIAVFTAVSNDPILSTRPFFFAVFCYEMRSIQNGFICVGKVLLYSTGELTVQWIQPCFIMGS
jgi:hypothetical protein